MTYTQVWDASQNKVSDWIILRDEDGAFIPFDEANVDYQAFLAWLDEGNQPTPYAPYAPYTPSAPGAQPKVKRNG